MPNHSKLRRIKLMLLMTFALAMLIGFLTLVPISDSDVPGSDKTHHLLAFFALALPLSAARPRWALWIALAATAYGGAIELIQPYVGRDKDIVDFIADAAGAMSGAALGATLGWLLDRRT